MRGTVELEAARRCFLSVGRPPGDRVPPGRDAVRAEVLASWERSRRLGVDPDRITARFVGHPRAGQALVSCAEDVFGGFLAANPEATCSLVLVDPAGVVRVRRDGGPALGRLLDAVLLVPGYGYGEDAVGTTAAAVALHGAGDAVVCGPEHYHGQLTALDEAAVPLRDDGTGAVTGAVVVACHAAEGSGLLLPLARELAGQVAERRRGEPHRRGLALLDALRSRTGPGRWALATDGDLVLTDAAARHLDAADGRVLSDLVLAALVLPDFAASHVDLPSGVCAEVATEPVLLGGEVVGCVLTGRERRETPAAEPPEAVRRQGSHVAPTARRDYAEDLRRGDLASQRHAEARIRANRELMSPYERARHQVAASVKQGRNHLLIGEPGVGKRTLLVEQFMRALPQGRVVTVDCAAYAAEPGGARADTVARAAADLDGRPHLLLLGGMVGLSPVAARRLDEALRPLVALPAPPLLVGCVDTPAVDATRPYGLLLRHFHEVTRVPALRYRVDEIGELAWAILRRLSARRALRLSLQVIRVLEGYAWPGNLSELEDVLRYVLARKPLGEIRPPDLPATCFQGRARRLSMLETAQADAIIQALYESRGNRYKAAAMLGIARSSLYRKIDAFGISYIA